MNGMENIAELLQSMLAGNDTGKDGEECDQTEGENPNGDCGESADDLFGGLDIDMILKLGTLFSEMQKPDKNTALLRALKPMMRDENRAKIETAIKLMRMMALLPLLRENGLADKIF